MTKEIVKAKKVDTIYKYLVNVLNGSIAKTEMIEVQEGLYISLCAFITDLKNTWDSCIEISVEDIDGSKLVSCKYQLSNFFKGIGDMLSNGEDWLINLSNEIYDNFVYEENEWERMFTASNMKKYTSKQLQEEIDTLARNLYKR